MGAGAVLGTFAAQHPKRRITWEEHSNQSLVPATASGMPNPVTVSLGGSPTPLPEARIVELKIRNAGRKDVEPGHFTSEDEFGLIFDFGAHIAAVLHVVSKPASAPQPRISLEGSELKIKKSHILKGQSLSYSVLVNGPERNVSVKTQAILNTPVKPCNSKQREKFFLIVGLAVFAVVGFNVVWFTQIKPEMSAASQYQHSQDCRYWDAHDPARAEKECTEIEKP